MYKFNDERVNDLLKVSDSYKFDKNAEEPKDPKDKIIRAFFIDANTLKALKKNPNETIIFNRNKEIKLEVGNYLTSNGKLIKKEVFDKVYKDTSYFVKKFLSERAKSTENIVDILDKLQNRKRHKPSNKI
jgi:hypothetical protein